MSALKVSRSTFNRESVRALQFLSVSFASASSNIVYISVVGHLTTLPFWLISLTSTEFSMIVNFILNDRITFRNLGSIRPWYSRLARFQVAAIGGNLLTVGIATFLHGSIGVSPVIAQILAIFLTFFVNFFTHRFWTFRSVAPTAHGRQTAVNDDINEPALRMRDRVTGISVIIPAHNESNTIRSLLFRLHRAMVPTGIPYEALIVDDYSTDGTAAVATSAIEEQGLPARVVSRKGPRGKSYSLMEGFSDARYPVLAMIDADLELPPESLPGMVRELTRYDVVVGRRLAYGENNFFRSQMSAVFNVLVLRLFLGINIEVQTGIKVFWKRVYESTELTPGPWGFDLEFVAKALAQGYRIGEYATPFRKRGAGKGHVNPITVAAELIASAVRIKLDILQTAKGRVALKMHAPCEADPTPPMRGLNEAFPLLLEWMAPLTLLYLLLRGVMGPAFFSSERFFGGPGDMNQYMWFIGWMWHAIAQGQSPFVTSAFGYPHAISIMQYTSVPTVGLLFGWLYSVAGVVFTFNLIFVVNYTLIFVFGKLTLRRLNIGRLMSGVGGLMFCLLPYLTVQETGHLNLAFIAPHFLVGYCIVRAVQSERRPGWSLGLLTGLALALTFYTSLETFLTLALCIAIVFAWAWVCARKITGRLTLRLMHAPFLLGMIAALLLLIPGLLNFLAGQTMRPVDFTNVAGYYSNDLLSLIAPSSLYLAHAPESTRLTAQFSGNPTEWDGYLSIPLIVLAFVHTARRWEKPSARILSLAALSMIVLSLGPFLQVAGARMYVPLPWILILVFRMPFVHNALPARLGLYAQYLALILVLLGVDEYVKQARVSSRPIGRTVGIGLNLVALTLVAVLWLPLLPAQSTPMPVASSVMRADHVVPRYIAAGHTLVLYEQDYGFSVVMGILADSDNYGLVTSNVYGYAMADTTSYKIDDIFRHDTDGKRTIVALRHYLPSMGVSKVMFVSIDNRPIDSMRLGEISTYLGAPIYDRQGLVVVWDVPQDVPVDAFEVGEQAWAWGHRHPCVRAAPQPCSAGIMAAPPDALH